MSGKGKLRGLLSIPSNNPPVNSSAIAAGGMNSTASPAGGQNSAALARLSALASPSAGASAGASCVALGQEGHLANLKRDMMQSEKALNDYLNEKRIKDLPLEQQTLIRLRERIIALEIQINTIEQNATTEYVTGALTGFASAAFSGAFSACKTGFSWLGRLTEYKYDPKDEEDNFKNTTYDNSMLLRLLKKAEADDNTDLIRLVKSRIELGKESRAAYLHFMAAHRLFHMYKGESGLIKLMNLKDLLETLFIFLATDELKENQHRELERFHGQSVGASQNVSSQYIVPSKFSRMSTGLKELIKKLINTNKSMIEGNEELKAIIKMLRTTGGGRELVSASAFANNGRVNFVSLATTVNEIKSRRDAELKALIDSLPDTVIAQTEQSIQTAEETSDELAKKMQPVIESGIATVMEDEGVDESKLRESVTGVSNAGAAAAGTGLNLTKFTFGSTPGAAGGVGPAVYGASGKRATRNANVPNAPTANATMNANATSTSSNNGSGGGSKKVKGERKTRKSRKQRKTRKLRKGRKD